MEANRAAENIQTIRTLMERSAIYRRALAPIMLLAGTIGILTSAAGLLAQVNSARAFVVFWLGAAAVAVVGALLLARRQAIKDGEAFWSAPTKRVTQALSLPLLTGMFLSVLPVWFGKVDAPSEYSQMAAMIWILFYGCALFTAGFFMPRAIKAFGTFFVLASYGLFWAAFSDKLPEQINPHCIMGFFFGALHLALGAYLYLTERKNSAA